MAGDPADIGGAPVDVTVVIIEHIFMCHRRKHQITASGVQHALGLAGRSRRVEDEQRILGIHLGRRAIGLRLGHGFVIPDVALVKPFDLACRALHHQHLLDHHVVAFGDLDGKVGVVLERDLLAPAQSFVGGNHKG